MGHSKAGGLDGIRPVAFFGMAKVTHHFGDRCADQKLRHTCE
jgi:hypothetical protein